MHRLRSRSVRSSSCPGAWRRIGLACLFLAGCDAVAPPGLPIPPNIDPARFVASVDNVFFPLRPGAVMHFQSSDEDVTATVEDAPHPILGVPTTVVREVVRRGGALVEETRSFYAQDKDGDVWLFGEDTRVTEDEATVSWEAGVGGARAGVVMWARPVPGKRYRQAYDPGRAEDVGEVMGLNETVTVPYGRFEGCLMIQETSALEPDERDMKYYCPGIGPVLTLEGGTAAVALTTLSRHE